MSHHRPRRSVVPGCLATRLGQPKPVLIELASWLFKVILKSEGNLIDLEVVDEGTTSSVDVRQLFSDGPSIDRW